MLTLEYLENLGKDWKARNKNKLKSSNPMNYFFTILVYILPDSSGTLNKTTMATKSFAFLLKYKILIYIVTFVCY